MTITVNGDTYQSSVGTPWNIPAGVAVFVQPGSGGQVLDYTATLNSYKAMYGTDPTGASSPDPNATPGSANYEMSRTYYLENPSSRFQELTTQYQQQHYSIVGSSGTLTPAQQAAFTPYNTPATLQMVEGMITQGAATAWAAGQNISSAFVNEIAREYNLTTSSVGSFATSVYTNLGLINTEAVAAQQAVSSGSGGGAGYTAAVIDASGKSVPLATVELQNLITPQKNTDLYTISGPFGTISQISNAKIGIDEATGEVEVYTLYGNGMWGAIGGIGRYGAQSGEYTIKNQATGMTVNLQTLSPFWTENLGKASAPGANIPWSVSASSPGLFSMGTEGAGSAITLTGNKALDWDTLWTGRGYNYSGYSIDTAYGTVTKNIADTTSSITYTMPTQVEAAYPTVVQKNAGDAYSTVSAQSGNIFGYHVPVISDILSWFEPTEISSTVNQTVTNAPQTNITTVYTPNALGGMNITTTQNVTQTAVTTSTSTTTSGQTPFTSWFQSLIGNESGFEKAAGTGYGIMNLINPFTASLSLSLKAGETASLFVISKLGELENVPQSKTQEIFSQTSTLARQTIPFTSEYGELTAKNYYEDPARAMISSGISLAFVGAGTLAQSAKIGAEGSILAQGTTGGNIYQLASRTAAFAMGTLYAESAFKEVTGVSVPSITAQFVATNPDAKGIAGVEQLFKDNYVGAQESVAAINRIETMDILPMVGTYYLASPVQTKIASYFQTRGAEENKFPGASGYDISEGFPTNADITTNDLINSFNTGVITSDRLGETIMANAREPHTGALERIPVGTQIGAKKGTSYIYSGSEYPYLDVSKAVLEGHSEISGAYFAPQRISYFTKAGNTPESIGLTSDIFGLYKIPTVYRASVESPTGVTPERISKDIASGKYQTIPEKLLEMENPINELTGGYKIQTAWEGILKETKWKTESGGGIEPKLRETYETIKRGESPIKIVEKTPTRFGVNDPLNPRNQYISAWAEGNQILLYTEKGPLRENVIKGAKPGVPIISQYGKSEWQFLIPPGSETSKPVLSEYIKDEGIRIGVRDVEFTGKRAKEYTSSSKFENGRLMIQEPAKYYSGMPVSGSAASESNKIPLGILSLSRNADLSGTNKRIESISKEISSKISTEVKVAPSTIISELSRSVKVSSILGKSGGYSGSSRQASESGKSASERSSRSSGQSGKSSKSSDLSSAMSDAMSSFSDISKEATSKGSNSGRSDVSITGSSRSSKSTTDTDITTQITTEITRTRTDIKLPPLLPEKPGSENRWLSYRNRKYENPVVDLPYLSALSNRFARTIKLPDISKPRRGKK